MTYYRARSNNNSDKLIHLRCVFKSSCDTGEKRSNKQICLTLHLTTSEEVEVTTSLGTAAITEFLGNLREFFVTTFNLNLEA